MDKVSLILKTFTQETTMHGLGHIANESKGKLRRFLWLFSFGCMVVLFLTILVQSSQRFSSYPVSTVMEYIRVQEMPFPSVTLCNINRVNNTFWKEQDELTQKVLRSEPVDLSDDETIERLRAMDYEQLMLDATHTAEETLMMTMFDSSLKLTNETIEFKRTEMSLCHTFHPASYINRHGPLIVTRVGMVGGLTIHLNVHRELYDTNNPHKVLFTGMSVLVHEPHEEPDISVKGVPVRAGTTTNIVISKQQRATLHHPFNSHVESCVDTDQTSFVNPLVHYEKYSYHACVTDCMIEYIREQCGCRVHVHEAPTVPPCSYEQYTNCGLPAWINFYLLSYEVHLCKCSRPCKETSYEMSVTSVTSDDEIVQKAYPDLDRTQRSNLVHLHIYFTDLGYTEIRQEPAYPHESFLAEVGGLFGLFIGASILTIVEMLELVVLVLLKLLCKRQNNQEKVKPFAENATGHE